MSDKNDELNINLDETESLDMGYVDEELEETYKPSSHLHVPQKAVDFYAEQGFELRWIRFFSSPDRGAYDVKNVSRKEAEGYTFVKRTDVPGLTDALTSFFGEKLAIADHGLYMIGEMALAKIPVAKVEAKQKYLENQTRSRNRAIIEDLRKNDVLPNKSRGEEFKTERSRIALPSSRKASLGRAAKAKVATTNDSE